MSTLRIIVAIALYIKVSAIEKFALSCRREHRAEPRKTQVLRHIRVYKFI